MKNQDVYELGINGDADAVVEAVRRWVWSENESVQDIDLDMEKAVEAINTMIMQGNSQAMNLIGDMYSEGRLVKESAEEAFKWYKIASECGDAKATLSLGLCYYYERGTEKNLEEAYKAFSKAVALDNGDAIIRLGDMFFNGDYVEEDAITAAKLYYKAAEFASEDLDDSEMQQTYSDAVSRFADCASCGLGIEQNYPLAVRLYGEALYYYLQLKNENFGHSCERCEETKRKLKNILKAI